MQTTSLALAFVLSLAAAAQPVSVAPKRAAPTHELLRFERTVCHGTCPSYVVTVSMDGTVEYEGREFVKTAGRRTAKLSPTELQALKAAFAEAKFFDLKGTYDCYEVTDHPSAVTTYRLEGRERTINHYDGCRSAPGDMAKLEKKIDELLHTERWIGTREERRKAFAL